MIEKNKKEIPLDYYTRQARVIMLVVSIETHQNGGWTEVQDAGAECVWNVKFAD